MISRRQLVTSSAGAAVATSLPALAQTPPLEKMKFSPGLGASGTQCVCGSGQGKRLFSGGWH